MLTEITKHLDDFYGHQRQSYISYEKEGKTIHKRFTIEYCDDEGKLERVDLLKEYGGLEIDDVYPRSYRVFLPYILIEKSS